MTEWILQKSTLQTILEPAFGLGIFSRILKHKKTSLNIFGVELDNSIYAYAKQICGSDVSIINNDYLRTEFGHHFDGIIANPPYLKFHEYDNKRYVNLINERFNYKLNAFTNIYALFLLKSINELTDGGRCAYIIPSEFLNADYGKAVKEALLKSGTLRHIIVFNSKESIFNEAITTSCIIYCERGKTDNNINFISINSISDMECIPDITSGKTYREDLIKTYAPSKLDPSIKWKNYLNYTETHKFGKFISFTTFAKVKRGIATGANAYFEFNAEKAERYNLSINRLRPCICHCTDVKGIYFDDAYHQKLASKNKKVYILDTNIYMDKFVAEYIRMGEKNKINKRYLTSHRNPWYAVEQRTPPPIWVSVFNRTGLRFIRNVSPAVNLTTFHCIYTTKLVADDLLFAYLITDVAKQFFSYNAREYGNGLQKFEPNDLNNAIMLDLRLLPEAIVDKVLTLYHKLIKDEQPELIDAINKIFDKFITTNDI